ncbi:hypothetical protein PIB30_119200 [Stylosanthes scabra]|uniref:CCHC-type domain-containing protein n=1 Tax=Stylosanthes scabra TaxID=79078 RepID=A0ABU6TPN6_9FABA|nr:hypothetical protein [Stylosanthes scabra]
MRHDHINTIPDSLIHKRWTKDAKKEYICSLTDEDTESEKIGGVRYGALATLCFTLCDKASKYRDDFMEIRDDIFGLIIKLHNRHSPNAKLPSTSNLVDDPSVVKTKGAPRQTSRAAEAHKCSNCKQAGHTVRRCPELHGGQRRSPGLNEDCCIVTTIYQVQNQMVQWIDPMKKQIVKVLKIETLYLKK